MGEETWKLNETLNISAAPPPSADTPSSDCTNGLDIPVP